MNKKIQQYKCQDTNCGKISPEWLLIKFRTGAGKLIKKCPYCRGKVIEIKETQQ